MLRYMCFKRSPTAVWRVDCREARMVVRRPVWKSLLTLFVGDDGV